MMTVTIVAMEVLYTPYTSDQHYALLARTPRSGFCQHARGRRHCPYPHPRKRRRDRVRRLDEEEGGQPDLARVGLRWPVVGDPHRGRAARSLADLNQHPHTRENIRLPWSNSQSSRGLSDNPLQNLRCNSSLLCRESMRNQCIVITHPA